jgi:hypothetical protein
VAAVSINILIPTTAVPSSFGMPTCGFRGVDATGLLAHEVNQAKRDGADWGSRPWSPSLC